MNINLNSGYSGNCGRIKVRKLLSTQYLFFFFLVGLFPIKQNTLMVWWRQN